MSIARAFTIRRDKDSDSMLNLHIGRATSQRAGKPVARTNISSPLALISTTNMISYNAPDIAGTAPISVRLAPSRSSSSSGDDESDRSVKSGQTVTDMSSLEASPISTQPEENHLSCYFKAPADSTPIASSFTTAAPNLPKRVPSHSKRAHEHLHRKRTIQRMLSPPPSTSQTMSATNEDPASSVKESTFVNAPRENPFRSELRELDEVAQGYSAGQVISGTNSTRAPVSIDDSPEASYLASRGLVHLPASEYLAEIQSLIYAHLADDVPAWI